MRNREPWYDSDNPSRVVRGTSWRAGVWIICAVLFAAAISAGIWVVKVATSETRGAGDAAVQVNSGTNRIAAQETFEALYQQIQTYDRQLDQAAQDKADHPGDTFFATNYSGLVKTCQDAIGQYNAAARQVSRAKWLTADLPYEINTNDSLFNCKETTK
jgi:hypothetical protein